RRVLFRLVSGVCERSYLVNNPFRLTEHGVFVPNILDGHFKIPGVPVSKIIAAIYAFGVRPPHSNFPTTTPALNVIRLGQWHLGVVLEFEIAHLDGYAPDSMTTGRGPPDLARSAMTRLMRCQSSVDNSLPSSNLIAIIHPFRGTLHDTPIIPHFSSVVNPNPKHSASDHESCRVSWHEKRT